MPIPFRSETLPASSVAPDGSAKRSASVEVRYDPLLGTTARIAAGVRLPTAEPGALAPLQASAGRCPFCGERIEAVTPRIDPSLSDEPRISVGEAVLFPNLVPYSRYAAVAVFTRRHWLDLEDFGVPLLVDNLAATLRYLRTVRAADPEARFGAWNVNYLYPSGGSLPHPHAQVYLDPLPTNRMRLEQEAAERYRRENGTCFWEDLVEAERGRGERFLWDLGSTAWTIAFAPVGFNEVHAVVRGKEALPDLDEADLRALAEGLARVLRWYAGMGLNSFNASLYAGSLAGDPAQRVRLAIVSRSAMVPYYRSDAMFLERLHWEAAVGRKPEDLARDLRARGAENASAP